MQLCILLLTILLFGKPKEAESACHNQQFTLNYARNCVENPVIKLPENFSVTINDDCMLELVGCLEVTRRFETAEGFANIVMPPLPPMEWSFDLCEMFEITDLPIFKKFTDLMNLPRKCPVEPMKICHGVDQKIDLTQFQLELESTARTNECKYEIIHENGKSCVEFNFTMAKSGSD